VADRAAPFGAIVDGEAALRHWDRTGQTMQVERLALPRWQTALSSHSVCCHSTLTWSCRSTMDWFQSPI
jgi:hypothetical protein